MCVGDESERERVRGREGERKRERKRILLRARCEEQREGEVAEVEPWALINETYAAAADTETHCKYGRPGEGGGKKERKEKLLSPGLEIYTCPNYTRVEASDPFVRRTTIRLGARAFFLRRDAR